MMQVSKRIPFEDPDVLNIVRGVYIASNVIIALVYLYIQSVINKKKGTQTQTQTLALAQIHNLPHESKVARLQQDH